MALKIIKWVLLLSALAFHFSFLLTLNFNWKDVDRYTGYSEIAFVIVFILLLIETITAAVLHKRKGGVSWLFPRLSHNMLLLAAGSLGLMVSGFYYVFLADFSGDRGLSFYFVGIGDGVMGFVYIIFAFILYFVLSGKDYPVKRLIVFLTGLVCLLIALLITAKFFHL